MAFIPVPDTVQVNIVFDFNGQTCENVIYYTKTTTPVLEDIALLTDEIRAYLVDNLMPLLHASVQLVRVVGILLDVADGLMALSTTGLPQAGANTSLCQANNVAFCISARTAHRGRSFRGRNYLMGFPSSNVSGSRLESSYAASLVETWAGLTDIGGDDGWARTIVSRIHAGAPRTTGVATPVTDVLALDTATDSQRRRLLGRGA